MKIKLSSRVQAPFLKCRTLMRMKFSLLCVIFIAQKSSKLHAGECVKTAAANEYSKTNQTRTIVIWRFSTSL